VSAAAASDPLAVAVDAARTAAALLLKRYEAGARGVQTKSSSTDLVSEADLEAERAIRAVLAQRRPDDAIVGEEGDDQAGTSGLRWIVDPLDGTTNYLFGVPQWSVSIACEGQAAVVLDPIADELFSVRAGAPAMLDGRALQGSRREDLATALVATGFGYEAGTRAAQGRVVAKLLPRVRDIRRMGSAALDLAWTAAGRYDAFYEHGVKLWDVAAGRMLCEAAGLTVRDLPATRGRPPGILVAAPALADELYALVSR
jgi:myo-inositol-1(or 4)-monophosphatase